jgi:hypothetical protein
VSWRICAVSMVLMADVRSARNAWARPLSLSTRRGAFVGHSRVELIRRGEVTHLHCKDIFSARLAQTRG